ncbi:helix-turn-helix domain-containing protein [Roseococcus pinisoli]|uniref:Helix-turn-helix transcriptional regulator n=1 Tax=Roseococcus pinisoli TaxID=2835040 RepID=A0ABS5Q8N2_9PROT|nr:helix-turn-helix transcriptional regulator [Roseococcus pinisoli]MBS7809315.1 helix-turn-helix transcriptional regulator [Roseococcus pinisoli]
MARPINLPEDIDASDQPTVAAFHRGTRKAARIRSHSHERGQLLIVSSGLAVTKTSAGSWVATTGSASWIPSGLEHSINVHAGTDGWFAYVRADACQGLPQVISVARASSLLREAVARCAQRAGEATDHAAEERLSAVILDEIKALTFGAAYLPMPAHDQTRQIADAIMRDPADNRPLAELADAVGLSRRTATRHFADETGLSFSGWRQRMRLLRAMEWLGEGVTVTETALSLGYDSPSAFTAMFRRSFGVPPAEYAGRRKASALREEAPRE